MSNAGISPRKETGRMSRYHATQDVKVQKGATHIAAYAGLFMLGNLGVCCFWVGVVGWGDAGF